MIEISVSNLDGIAETYVVIENANGSQTSMLKSTYDEQQAQLTQLTTEGA
jgi:hypothetical protein